MGDSLLSPRDIHHPLQAYRKNQKTATKSHGAMKYHEVAWHHMACKAIQSNMQSNMLLEMATWSPSQAQVFEQKDIEKFYQHLKWMHLADLACEFDQYCVLKSVLIVQLESARL